MRYRCDDELARDERRVGLFRTLSFLSLNAIITCFFAYFGSLRVEELASPRLAELNVPFPVNPSTSIPHPETLLFIGADGSVSFQGVRWTEAEHDLDWLSKRLKTAAPFFPPDKPLRVRPEPDVVQQRLVDILNSVRRAGIADYVLE